jgi:hypothetical protein
MRGLLAGVMVVAMVSVGHAQAPGESPPTEITVHRKDPNKATMLTGLGIAVPAAILTLGVTTDIDEGGTAGVGFMLGWIMPAAGHWYAGRVGTYGIVARLGGISLFMAGLSEIDDAKQCARGIEVSDGCDGVSRGVGRAGVALGAGLYVGSLVYDVVSSRGEVRESNARHRVQVAPLMMKGSTGLALSGAF